MCCFVLYNVEVCGIVIGRRLTSSSYSRPSAEVQDFTANTATACSSKISGALYQTTRRHVPEDFNFSIRCPKSLLCPNVCLVVAIHFNILTVTAGCNKELNFFWHTHTHTHTHTRAPWEKLWCFACVFLPCSSSSSLYHLSSPISYPSNFHPQRE
jgi:hypothetical protein